MNPQYRGPAGEWKKAREEALRLANYKCNRCPVERPKRLRVHHIVAPSDGVSWDNAQSNLEVMCISCHMRRHQTGRRRSAETRAKISLSNSRRVWSKSSREKVGERPRGKVASLLTRERISEAGKGRHHSELTKERIANSLKLHWSQRISSP